MDDLWRLRLRNNAFRPPRPSLASGGAPAFVGRVTTISPAVGEYLLVTPVTVTGAEVEGGTGTIIDGSGSVPVYLVGPSTAITGELLACRFVDYRWVAERVATSTGGGTAFLHVVGCDIPPGIPVVIYQSGTPVASGTTDPTTGLIDISALTPGVSYMIKTTAYGAPRWSTTGSLFTIPNPIPFPGYTMAVGIGTGPGYICVVDPPCNYPLSNRLTFVSDGPPLYAGTATAAYGSISLGGGGFILGWQGGFSSEVGYIFTGTVLESSGGHHLDGGITSCDPFTAVFTGIASTLDDDGNPVFIPFTVTVTEGTPVP